MNILTDYLLREDEVDLSLLPEVIVTMLTFEGHDEVEFDLSPLSEVLLIDGLDPVAQGPS
jgi:hypothetical protein